MKKRLVVCSWCSDVRSVSDFDIPGHYPCPACSTLSVLDAEKRLRLAATGESERELTRAAKSYADQLKNALFRTEQAAQKSGFKCSGRRVHRSRAEAEAGNADKKVEEPDYGF